MGLINVQTVLWQCDRCGKETGVRCEPIIPADENRGQIKFTPGAVVGGRVGEKTGIVPLLPDGWIRIGKKVFCPDHDIEVRVDGRETAIL